MSVQATGTAPHRVQFYDGERGLVASVARFLGSALGAGDVAIAIATAPHLAAIEAELGVHGLDLGRARAAGCWVALEASETLARIAPEGEPEPELFSTVLGGAVRDAAARGGPVHVFGELVALLREQGRDDAALRLERMWNELHEELVFSLLCAYPIRQFASDSDGRAFLSICAEHTGIVPDGSPAPRSAAAHRPQPGSPGSADRDGPLLESASEAPARLASIVESSDDAIIGKTLEGVVTSWNRGAERIFGYRADEMIGHPITRIFPTDRRHEFPMILQAIRRGERVDHYETERVRKDGRRIYVSLTVSPIEDATGRIIGVSKIARDVTERRRIDEQREQLIGVVQRAHAELEAASRAKDDFLATLAHELRNPIAAVRNAVESARFDALARDRALDIASRQARQLARLVDDLLDMSRVTQGRVRLNRELVPVNEIVASAVEATRFRLEEQGHKLTVRRASEAVRVECDPLRLEQVLVNLIGNAAKFTPRGGRIAVHCDGENGSAVVRVRDNGVGIRPEQLARIFEPFVQLRREGDPARDGLGIGLMIAKSFVTLHGGTLEAHSDGPGMGAEFVVRLPLASAGGSVAAAPPARPEPSAAGVHVLVVEDNADVAEGMVMLLEAFGHRVRVASDGLTALAAAREEAPDVMLVDIGLPNGMDGYEVARRVREAPLLRDVALIALTGYGLDEDRKRARAAGFDLHLTKPVDPKVLRSCVARAGSALARSLPDGSA